MTHRQGTAHLLQAHLLRALLCIGLILGLHSTSVFAVHPVDDSTTVVDNGTSEPDPRVGGDPGEETEPAVVLEPWDTDPQDGDEMHSHDEEEMDCWERFLRFLWLPAHREIETTTAEG